jgi:YggT family protein
MLTATSVFLINILFGLYIFVVILRFLLQAVRANFNNPLTVFAVRFTQPVVRILQKVLPQWRSFDLAVLAFAFVLELIKCTLLTVLTGKLPQIAGLLIVSAADLLAQFCSCYFYLLIMRFILSWIAPTNYNPIAFLITQLTEPLLQPVRRFIPPIGGFDLSGLVVIILLQLFQAVFLTQLILIGRTLL